jgi:type VI protein secretion system component VasF
MPTEIRTETKIVQICEPIFLYICELNRFRREGITEGSRYVQYEAVHDRVESLLETAQKAAQASNRLRGQWNDIEKPLYCFLDSMIEDILGAREGVEALPCADEWSRNRLAEKFEIVAGEDAFFDYMDETLAKRDNDGDARERLEFFFACLELGFMGKYKYGDAEGLADVLEKLAGRVQHLLRKGKDDLFTPETYEHTNTTSLTLEPQPVLWGVVIVTVFAVVFFFIATGHLYHLAADQLDQAIKTITSTH